MTRKNELDAFLKVHESVDLKRLLADGVLVGSWRVMAFIARGGCGEVYRVEHIKSGAIGALKVLHRNDLHLRRRFELESEILQKISSRASTGARYFPRLLDKGEISTANVPYIVIEFLHEFKLPEPPKARLKDSEIAKLILAVCEAISELHDNGYLHRDIKVENLMRRENGEIVLIDYGFALRIKDIENPLAERVSVVQGQKIGVGTPGSTAPEQAFGTASISSDIYALGALANQCFRGYPPSEWIPIIQKATSPAEEFRYHSTEGFKGAVHNCVLETQVDLDRKVKSDGSGSRKTTKSIVNQIKKIAAIGFESADVLFTVMRQVLGGVAKRIKIIIRFGFFVLFFFTVTNSGKYVSEAWASVKQTLLSITNDFKKRIKEQKEDVRSQGCAVNLTHDGAEIDGVSHESFEVDDNRLVNNLNAATLLRKEFANFDPIMELMDVGIVNSIRPVIQSSQDESVVVRYVYEIKYSNDKYYKKFLPRIVQLLDQVAEKNLGTKTVSYKFEKVDVWPQSSSMPRDREGWKDNKVAACFLSEIGYPSAWWDRAGRRTVSVGERVSKSGAVTVRQWVLPELLYTVYQECRKKFLDPRRKVSCVLALFDDEGRVLSDAIDVIPAWKILPSDSHDGHGEEAEPDFLAFIGLLHYGEMDNVKMAGTERRMPYSGHLDRYVGYIDITIDKSDVPKIKSVDVKLETSKGE